MKKLNWLEKNVSLFIFLKNGIYFPNTPRSTMYVNTIFEISDDLSIYNQIKNL